MIAAAGTSTRPDQQAPNAIITYTGPADSSGPTTLPQGAGASAVAHPAGDTIRWTGTIKMQQFGVMNLDLLPPQKDPFNGNIWLGVINSPSVSVMTEGRGAIAVVDDHQQPDFTTCRETSLTQGLRSANVHAGDVLCVVTAGNRTARMITKAVDEMDHTISFDTVVWATIG